ncbi:molybdate transport system ATP-binding protein [Chitinophaga sp. YR627]|uniref:ABC transporter ATP-binding protein n=1 Tax=Chitinophaga sp. YR627 TaxID=1881041 RepID=UPI0008E54198|nr:ABC transporter ATP-binding protein [Chitinophaga sp. YR627]SFN29400.1 molybdate transport system ATP-binding protein [Chitinophaga sp. YR627]
MIDFALQKTLHTAEGELPFNVSARIERGQFVGLYGVSGAGKTSVLRMLAGFMKPDDGYIKVGSDFWFYGEEAFHMPTQHRSIGFVFQDYALFPNMNVEENIAFALRKNESRTIVDELLELTGLKNLAKRKIQTLSGGQQQRVALARAIAKRPALLLLDEPLSALDSGMRAQLQETLLDVHKRYGLTTILVSHNAEEMVKLADTVIHLENGRFQRQMPPASFFLNGEDSSGLKGRVVSIAPNGEVVVQIESGVLRLKSVRQDVRVNDHVDISCDVDMYHLKKS